MTNPTPSAEERVELYRRKIGAPKSTALQPQLEELIRQAEQDARAGFASGLFEAIEHGDDEHRAWLKQAIEDFVAGRPVRRPVGKGSVAAARADERRKTLEEAAHITRRSCKMYAGKGYVPNEDATGLIPCAYCAPARQTLGALTNESGEPGEAA